ncbi:MAG: hypothetical protein M0Q92_09530 [Methanoregula sp.]|jgi:hypothetical protein|nr:hypothetical protein [Methanoregula sp.]
MDSNLQHQPIPFFVVDRPISLKILEYCGINNQPFTLGLMGHGNTTKEFQEAFKNFDNKNVKKIVDSGVFTKNGCMNGYDALLSTYTNMGADFGIVIDILKDKEKTLESAHRALKSYDKEHRPFKLIGVAQGNNIQEYLECYQSLKDMGYDHIAIGGLLKKSVNSARYVKVHDEKFLTEVVSEIREIYPADWLFLLGCYHPRRHKIFAENQIFGGDYKGWIFQYKPPEDWIKSEHQYLTEFEQKNTVKNVDPELVKHRSELSQNLHLKDIALVDKTEYRVKIKEIDTSLIKQREQSSVHDPEYRSHLKTLETIFNSDEEELRVYRFDQVRNYIESQVYANFRKRLLIIGCSDKKKATKGFARAIQIYDGPNYLSIRKLRNSCSFPQDVQLMIISAKYGLIFPDQLIENYDQRMTSSQAMKMKSELNKKLGIYIADKNFQECYLNLGKIYRDSVADTLDSLDFPLNEAKGKIGEKRSQMLQWLKK